MLLMYLSGAKKKLHFDIPGSPTIETDFSTNLYVKYSTG